ncbi:hypothetical protein FRAHR75_510018 [Frankia sp. Hr75.2]|nr:hypothetical protein FRAHR75_510018 [Frankia sp. Hr75.2]
MPGAEADGLRMEGLAVGYRAAGYRPAGFRRRARCEVLAGHEADELSDGERQRVMMARALAQEPTLVLLDEPTAFLDAPSRVAVTALLRRLARERDLAVVVSTHDLELSLRVADGVWLLDRTGTLHTGRPAEVIASGAVNTTFDGDDLRFDPVTRTFELREAV